MKNGSILLVVILSLFLSGCGVYAMLDPSPPNPSPTPIAVSTLAPPTATASPELEPAAQAPEEAVQATATERATPTEMALPTTPTFTPEPDWLAYSGRTEEGLMFLGNPEAPVKMIDFSDFMCPTCRTYVLEVEPLILEKYVKSGQLLIIFAPVLNHADLSDQTHQAAECAAEQEQFWEFYHLLFERQNDFWQGDIQVHLKSLAAEANLEVAQFNSCLDEQRYFELVRSQDEFRQEAGIRGQPVFYINGDYVVGSQPFEVLQATIETKLTGN